MAKRLSAALTAVLVLGIAAAATGQKVIERPLRGNPYRDAGGSCIYSGSGRLVFAPRGASCPELQTQQEAASSAPLSAEMERGVRDLLATYPHIADEIVKARNAVSANDHEGALKALDHVLGEVSASKAASERLVEELSRPK